MTLFLQCGPTKRALKPEQNSENLGSSFPEVHVEKISFSFSCIFHFFLDTKANF